MHKRQEQYESNTALVLSDLSYDRLYKIKVKLSLKTISQN